MGDEILPYLLTKYDTLPDAPFMKVLKQMRKEDYEKFPPPVQSMLLQGSIHDNYTDASVVEALKSDTGLLERLKNLMSGRMLPYARHQHIKPGDLVHYFDHVWVLIGEEFERLVLFRQEDNVLVPLFYCGKLFEDHHKYNDFLNQLDGRWREVR